MLYSRHFSFRHSYYGCKKDTCLSSSIRAKKRMSMKVKSRGKFYFVRGAPSRMTQTVAVEQITFIFFHSSGTNFMSSIFTAAGS